MPMEHRLYTVMMKHQGNNTNEHGRSGGVQLSPGFWEHVLNLLIILNT